MDVYYESRDEPALLGSYMGGKDRDTSQAAYLVFWQRYQATTGSLAC